VSVSFRPLDRGSATAGRLRTPGPLTLNVSAHPSCMTRALKSQRPAPVGTLCRPLERQARTCNPRPLSAGEEQQPCHRHPQVSLPDGRACGSARPVPSLRYFVLVVKRNQPRLRAALRALPWKKRITVRYDRETGHGRRETRSVRVLTVTGLGLDFPHVTQAVKIHRYRTDAKSGKTTRQTVHRYAFPPGIPAASRTTRPRPLGHRVDPPREGHDLRRGRLPDPHRARPGEHGHTAQPRSQHTPRRRPPQHRRRATTSLLPTLHTPTRPARTHLVSAGCRTIAA
jgi:hypothetical protein